MRAIDPSETLASKFAVMHNRRRPECDRLGSPGLSAGGKPHETGASSSRLSAEPPAGHWQYARSSLQCGHGTQGKMSLRSDKLMLRSKSAYPGFALRALQITVEALFVG
jgi:hypothetical protein